jgi:hypothetical protein
MLGISSIVTIIKASSFYIVATGAAHLRLCPNTLLVTGQVHSLAGGTHLQVWRLFKSRNCSSACSRGDAFLPGDNQVAVENFN